MTSEKNKGLLAGIITGGIIGGVIALLYAPKSGKEIRRDIKDKSNEFKEDAVQYYNDTMRKTSELWDMGKEKASTMVTDIRSKASELLSTAKEEARDTKNTLVAAANNSDTNEETRSGRTRKTSVSENLEAHKDALKSGWNEGTNTYKEEKSNRLRK